MVKRGGNRRLGRPLAGGPRPLGEGSEALGLSSRVRRAAPRLRTQPDELLVASHGLAKTAALTMRPRRSSVVSTPRAAISARSDGSPPLSRLLSSRSDWRSVRAPRPTAGSRPRSAVASSGSLARSRTTRWRSESRLALSHGSAPSSPFPPRSSRTTWQRARSSDVPVKAPLRHPPPYTSPGAKGPSPVHSYESLSRSVCPSRQQVTPYQPSVHGSPCSQLVWFRQCEPLVCS